MGFDRSLLPDPADYYGDREGLKLTGTRSSPWRTTECRFHGGSDSLRINLRNGAFVCMAGCGAKGGDVLAYHRAAHGLGFVEAARELGCWVEDGQPEVERKPAPLPARDALHVLAAEANLVAVAAGNLATGRAMNQADLQRLALAASRIALIAGVAA